MLSPENNFNSSIDNTKATSVQALGSASVFIRWVNQSPALLPANLPLLEPSARIPSQEDDSM